MGPGKDNTMTDKETLWAIPKLTSDGSNWVTFKTHFLFAIAGHNVNRHFDGSDTAPPAPTFSTPDEIKWTTADWDKHQAYLLLVRKWKHNEHVAWAQLAQVISDSLLIRIQHARTLADMWRIIVTELDKKGCMVQVDLCCWMMEKHVSEMDNICIHLDDMALSYECLSGMGFSIHDEDYVSMVLMSLPDSYTTHVETLTDTAISSGHTFTAYNFITKVIELSDKQQLQANNDPSQAIKTLHSNQQSPATNRRRETQQKGKSNALIATRRGTSPMIVTAPGGPRRGNTPPSPMTVLPMLPPSCRTVLGLQSHLDTRRPYPLSPLITPI